ncbi:MAG: arylsulfatase [Candidatus Hinthialibacter antarcticus]|nr:arylsulfatase [Candidatus Hinthialibacter antarcticus]
MNPISRRKFVKNASAAGLGSAALSLASCAGIERRVTSTESTKRPNIILIMGDDMGFSDLGCYGSEIHTPNLDRLAGKGVRFTQFYNTARCCPTRASLLSGLYSHQAGVGHMMTDRNLPGYRGNLNRNCVTIAEALKGAGYSTYMSGKWHVTPNIKPDGSRDNWPRQRGFDRFFGTIHGAGSFFDPNTLTLDNNFIAPWDGFYYTDAISDYASHFIENHREDNPFFMYVSYTAAHWPMHAKPEDIAKYKGRYDAGWDALRKERHERMVKLGLIDPKWEMTPRDEGVPAWEDEPMKEWHARRMEVYAAMVDCMDQGIGRIIDTLEANGELDNTLVFFLQDNGGCAEEYGSGSAEKPDPSEPVMLKPMALGELQTDMQPKVTRDGRPVRTGKGVMPGAADTYIAYGKGWANASNTPFRLYKHWEHEGGISTPLIVHWPDRVTDHGALREQPGHLIDIMATCVDVANAEYPTEYNGNPITPMEGLSLLPAFDGQPLEREAIYWEHEGNRAVRVGDWKLVARVKRNLQVTPEDQDAWELYDLSTDRTEMHNLIDVYPGRAARMKQMWDAWAKRANVLPWPWEKA